MATWTGKPAAGTDDASETEAGTVVNNATTSELKGAKAATNIHWWACRFPNVTIPANAVVTSVLFKVWVTAGTEVGKATMACSHESSATAPPTFGTTAKEIFGNAEDSEGKVRQWTKYPSKWETAITAGAFNNPPTSLLTIPVEGTLQLPGWASGHSLVIMIIAEAATKFTIQNFDKEAGVKSAELTIEYFSRPASGLMVPQSIKRSSVI